MSQGRRSGAKSGSGGAAIGARASHEALFFSTPELLQRLDLLRHLIEDTELVALVQGGEGAGKTTLSQRLQALAGANWELCRVDGHPLLQPDQLLTHCAQCFGLSATDTELEVHLAQCFRALRAEDRIPVILVDDAHLLPLETLAFLARLHEQDKGDFPLVRLVLFVDPHVDDLLSAPQLKLVRLHPLTIPPLKAGQIPLFVNYLLAQTPFARKEPLPAVEVGRLYRESGGVPGKIRELLRSAYRTDEAGIRSGWQRLSGKWILAGVLGGLLLLVLIYQDEINRALAPPDSTETDLPVPGLDEKWLAPPAELPLPEQAAAAAGPQPPAATGERGMATRVPTQSPAAVVIVDRGSPPPAVAPKETEKAAEGGEQGPDSPVPADVSVPPKAVDGAAVGVRSQPEAAKAITKTGLRHPASGGIGGTGSPRRSGNEPQPTSPEVRQAPAAPGPANEGVHREAWLLDQDPRAYTLQLIGVSERSRLIRFIKRHGLQGKVAYFETLRQGRPWYSLVYGAYPDPKAARSARLPKKLRKKDLWVRRLEAVQKEIRAHTDAATHSASP